LARIADIVSKNIHQGVQGGRREAAPARPPRSMRPAPGVPRNWQTWRPPVFCGCVTARDATCTSMRSDFPTPIGCLSQGAHPSPQAISAMKWKR